MGGADKAFLELRGCRLIDICRDRLAPQAGPLAVSANGDPARFAATGLTVLADGAAGQAGPLAGILAAMTWAAALGADQVVTVAVDTPFFPDDLVARLRVAGPAPVLAATPDGRHGTFGLWPTGLRDVLRADIEAGMRKVTDWADRHGARTADFASGPFFNINTPADLAEAEARA